MIPKYVHYCWLSNNPVPSEMHEYILTWEKYLPDYEFIKWDFSRFDKNSSIWVQEAFDNKKYAFAADYIRLYALYTMGGIYLDMDVEILKSFDPLLVNNYFICFENNKKNPVLEMATLGAEKGCWWIKKILNYYKDRHFIKDDGIYDTKTLPQVVKDVFQKNDIILKSICCIQDFVDVNDNTILVLPYDFFSPKSYETEKVELTSNTYSIHHFASSWIPIEQRIERKFWQFFGLKEHRVMWHVDKWVYKLFHVAG